MLNEGGTMKTNDNFKKCGAVKFRTICKQKETCERFLINSTPNQEYFSTAPFAILEDGVTICDYYVEAKETSNE